MRALWTSIRALWKSVFEALSTPLSSGWAWFVASAGLALAVVAYYEHARQKERPQAIGVGIAALGLFVWAGFRGPFYSLFVILIVAWGVPWLIWSRRAKAVRVALIARSPVTIERRVQPPPVAPTGDRGILDFKLDAQRSTIAMSDVLKEMSELMKRQTKRTVRYTKRMERETRRGGAIERVHPLSERVARDLEVDVDDFDRLELRLRAARESMTANTTAWLRTQSPGAELDRFRALLGQLAETTKQGRGAIESYRTAITGLRRLGLSQSVNRASDRLIKVVTRIIEDVAAAERFYRNPVPPQRRPRR